MAGIASSEQFTKVFDAFFEPQLVTLGLSEEQIKQQTIKELQQSLKIVDDAITNPQSFGMVNIMLTAEGEPIIIRSSSERLPHYTLGVLPNLLKRKKLILDRLNVLEEEEKIAKLKEKMLEVQDPVEKNNLQKELEKKETEKQLLEEKFKKLELQELQADREQKIALAKLEMEKEKRKSKFLQSFFAKESVATLVGAILLIGITLFLVVAAFTNTKPPEILSNAFLVVLGYFFGQAVTQAAQNLTDKDGD